MTRRLARVMPIVVLLAACGDDPIPCSSQRDCQSGFRCQTSNEAFGGTCVACDATETTYDGVDNDCNPATRDDDLDQDGQSPRGSGAIDCNDDDDTIFQGAQEVCSDQKDNDCDLTVDEPDCADLLPPVLRIVEPTSGAPLSGNARVVIEATDDYGVDRVEVALGSQTPQSLTAPTTGVNYEFSIETVNEVDGPAILTARAIDKVGRSKTTTISVQLDNRSPPEVTPISPLDGASHAGRLDVSVDVTDASGVASVELLIDGRSTAIWQQPPYETTLDTDTLAEGLRQADFVAVDTRGNSQTRSVLFRVDRAPPIISVTDPTPGSRVGGVIPVVVSAQDESGLADILVEGQSAGPVSPATLMLDTTALPNGHYTITTEAIAATLVDGLPGLHRATATVDIDVANFGGAPVINLLPHDGDAVYGVTQIAASVRSPIRSAIQRVELRVDGSPWASLTQPTSGSTYATYYDFAPFSGTTAVIGASAWDNQGNVGTATVTVTVVRSPKFRLTKVRPVGVDLARPTGFVVRDLDQDEIPDVVIPGARTQFLKGTIANGEWSPQAPSLVQALPSIDVTTGDIDDDGTTEIFILRSGGVDVVRLGTPVATTVASIVLTGATAFDVGDMDLDGDLDVVVGFATSPGNDLAVWLYDRAGQRFVLDSLYGRQGNVGSVVVRDVDGTNGPDVLIGRTGTGNNLVTTYPNVGPNGPDGPAKLRAGQDSFTDLPEGGGSPPERIVVADVMNDGDAFPDVVCLMPSGPPQRTGLAVLRGNPRTPGTFDPYSDGYTRVVMRPRSIAVGDVTGDGLVDLVMGSESAHGIEVWKNVGAGRFELRGGFIMELNLGPVRLADLDGDDRLDVLGLSRGSDSLVWARNLGEGDFDAAPYLFTPRAAMSVAAADMLYSAAPDGVADLVFGMPRVGNVPASLTFLKGRGAAAFELAAEATLPNDPSSLAVGDIDGDQKLDVAYGSAASSPEVGSFLMSPDGTYIQHSLEVVGAARDVEIADIDGDLKGEVIWTQDFTGTPPPTDGAVVLDDDTGTTTLLRRGQGARDLAVGDLSRDGTLDFAVANSVTDDVSVHVFNGSGFDSVVYNGIPTVSSIATGRYGNDDITDLVAVSTRGFVMLEGDPIFGFRPPVIYPAGTNPTASVSGDFNGDGLLDVIVINSGDRISLLLAHPQGGFFLPTTLSVSDTPLDFAVADLTGDGVDDLVIGHSGVAPGLMFLVGRR